MQKKKHRKFNFQINHCSSQDPEYPAAQLLLQSPDAKGWQSKRFSNYPQIIIIQLVQSTLLRQISLLSHQSKITTKIQIQAKLGENKEWNKLGYVSLTSNQNTNFQARQLRTANLNGVPANLIKLVLKSNHINSQNIFNQVSLISLSVYGDKMTQNSFQYNQGNKQVTNGLELDKQTLNKLNQLEVRKKQAVNNQEFDLAKNIKEEIERIKNIGQTLSLLQKKKQQAIKKEDYQTAKIINQQMKRMRDQNQWGTSLTNKPPGNPGQLVKKQRAQQSHEQEQSQESYAPVSNQQNVNPRVRRQAQNRNPANQDKQPQKAQYGTGQRSLNNAGNRKVDMEDRPLDNIRGRNKMPTQFQNQQQPREGGELQPLSKEVFAECQPFFNVIDQQIFCNLYSKDYKNRENGMRMIRDKLSQKITDRQTFIQAMLFAIKCTIDDRIASVLIVTLEVFDQFLRKMKPTANSNNLEYAEYIIQKICDYLGHTNQKIVNASESILGNLPVYQLTNKDVCYKCLAMSYKREKGPKIVTGRLKMIAKIVTQYQLGKSYSDTINYVAKYIDDKNNDVRGAAMKAILAISNEIGYSAVQPFLKNVRPQVIKAIEQQMQNTEGDNNRNFDDRPIKSKTNPSNAMTKNTGKQRDQIQTVDNQFIQVPKNTAAQNQIFCPFCKKADQKFVQEDYLDMHMFHSCPMLTICLECKQTIQISTLTSHMVGQCQNSKYFKKCPRCKQAVHQKIFKTHVQKKQCLSSKPMAAANRCPLCHLDINPGVNGWKQHLVDQGCENNPRK